VPDKRKHEFEERPKEADGPFCRVTIRYQCKYCGWGTNFPEMYDTDQDWRDQPTATPLRIVGVFHGCGDTVPPDEAQFGYLRRCANAR
jgi:hypothetical protein